MEPAPSLRADSESARPTCWSATCSMSTPRISSRAGIDITVKEGPDLRRDRPSRHDLGQRRQGDRQADRRRDEEGRQRGRDHGRGGQDRRDRALDVVEGRGCSPTGATSRPISSPAPKRWWPRLEDAHILIHEKKLSSLQLLPSLEAAVQTAKPLLLVAEDIERRRHRSGGGAALLRAQAAVGKLKDQS